jgi:hypothetical protein
MARVYEAAVRIGSFGLARAISWLAPAGPSRDVRLRRFYLGVYTLVSGRKPF